MPQMVSIHFRNSISLHAGFQGWVRWRFGFKGKQMLLEAGAHFLTWLKHAYGFIMVAIRENTEAEGLILLVSIDAWG